MTVNLAAPKVGGGTCKLSFLKSAIFYSSISYLLLPTSSNGILCFFRSQECVIH